MFLLHCVYNNVFKHVKKRNVCNIQKIIIFSYCSCLNRCLKTTKTDSFCKTIFTSIWHVCWVLCIESGTVNSWKKSLILFFVLLFCSKITKTKTKKPKWIDCISFRWHFYCIRLPVLMDKLCMKINAWPKMPKMLSNLKVIPSS